MQRWAGSGWKLPALAGLLLTPSYFLPVVPLNFVIFVPLLYWFDQHPRRQTWDVVRAALAFGFAGYSVSLHFAWPLVRFSWLAILLYLGILLAFVFRAVLIFLLLSWLRRRSGLPWWVLLPAVWVTTEWLSAFGDLRTTADHLVNTLAGTPFLVQIADVVGPYGVGAILLILNGLLYAAWVGRKEAGGRRAAYAVVAIVAIVLAYDGWSWFRPLPAGREVRVALVQPDIPLLVKWDEQSEAEQLRTLGELTRQVAQQQPDLIVWPESARPAPLYHWLDRPETRRMAEVQWLAKEIGIPILTGVEYARVRTQDDWDLYNAALWTDSRGKMGESWSAKTYLVPFAEQLPFKWIFGRFIGRGGEWRWVAGGFEPGPRGAVLDIEGMRVGVLVCYEQQFPDLVRRLRNAGAELQIVITNDAWFGRTPWQQYQADVLRLRGIENRSAFVRVANTGISGLVDARGEFHEPTRLFEQAVRVFDVTLNSERTIYDRVGDAPAWLAAAALLAACGLAWTGRSG